MFSLVKLNCIVIFVINIENFKKVKYHMFKKSLSVVYIKCSHEYYDNVKKYQKIYNHA